MVMVAGAGGAPTPENTATSASVLGIRDAHSGWQPACASPPAPAPTADTPDTLSFASARHEILFFITRKARGAILVERGQLQFPLFSGPPRLGAPLCSGTFSASVSLSPDMHELPTLYARLFSDQ